MKSILLALTGPSGVGKTTLGDLLVTRDYFLTPVHTTTRKHRDDDQEGFYRYISHEQFKKFAEENAFLFWSGDSHVIDSKYGNYYGILKQDYENLSSYDRVLFYISYKDIPALYEMKKQGYPIQVVNLLYQDLKENMPIRLSDSKRNQTKEEIEHRIQSALEYEEKYRKVLDSYSDILKIYSDVFTIEETYQEVQKSLKI